MIARPALIWFVRLVLAGWPLAGVAAQAATYTATANRDAMLVELNPNGNYGTVTELLVKTNGSGSDRHRPIYGFTLPSIPTNETITSATIRLWVTQQNSNSAAIHRVTDSWTEATVTWSNTGADFQAAAEATFTPSPVSAYVTVNITALVQGWRNASIANHGVMVLGATNADAKLSSREWSTSTQRPQLVITTARIVPALTVLKSSAVVSDPLNGTTNPKAIPGAVVNYSINVTNTNAGTADSGTTMIADAVPSNMRLYVGDVSGVGSGPAAFTNGSPSSGLTYTFTSLSSTTDSIAFSNNGGATFSYTPVPDADGYDGSVTHFRVIPSGSFAGNTGSGNPSFQIQVRMRIQ